MLKRFMTVVAVAVILFLGIGLSLPKDFELVRSVRIPASPLRVLQQVSNLNRWEAWWPWERENAGKRLQIEGEAANVGAALSWSGRPAPGRLVLTRTTISSIEYDIHFDANQRPDHGAFELRGSEKETELTWRVKGHFERPILGGYLARMANAMHGGMLDWGLSNIKDQVAADTSELNIYYEDEEGREAVQKIE